MYADREVVELFHLQLLRHLNAGRDKGRYVVKGGCNLRFFFGSIRYSQDLDLDVDGVSFDALQDRIEGILASRALADGLASVGIGVTRRSAPKQTATTQRWKAELRPTGAGHALHTKIEFSRRGRADVTGLEAVDARLVGRYRLSPLLACHYLLPAAIRQKVRALVDRREVQARDVFDLGLLFSRAGNDPLDLGEVASHAPRAAERVCELSYADYRSQVVAYLEPEHAEGVDSAEAWDALQVQVLSALQRGGPMR